MRRLLSLSMFSWQWTVGAWAAGGGEAISDMLFGGHSTNSEMRQFALIRWLRMLGIVKFGIPLAMQAAIKGFATACAPFLRGGDPDDEALAEEIGQMPWLTFNNESKAGSLSFDITPILKLAARVPAVKELKKADIPVISALIPAYVGEGRNTTGKRRYYMHFGKQSDEFFRWFSDPLSQFVSKLSIPHQKLLEGFFGRLQPNGYSKGFAESSFVDRWFNLSMDADKSALWNLASAMGSSFSWQSIVANPDAGFIAAVGPMRMGQSKRSTRLRIAERVAEFAEDDRTNNPWSYSRNRRKFNLMCTDILREAQMNGIDPAEIMTSALGDVAKIEYDKLFTAFPKDLGGAPDIDKMLEAVRALTRLNRKYVDIKSNIVQKFKAAGTDIKKNREYYQAVMSLLHASLGSPFLVDETAAEALFEKAARSTQMAVGGGDGLADFLASDEVPETLFGVPIVVGDRMTDQDRAFFKEFPEAGGYYDLDGTAADFAGGDADPDRFHHAINEVIPFIKKHEGFRENAYQDSVGKWTIGYGQTEIDGRPVREGDVIDEATASKFVEQRVRDNAIRMHKEMPWTDKASKAGLAAMYDLAYNMGLKALGSAKSPALNREGMAAVDSLAADAAIMKQVPTYVKAGGKRLKGLVNRRNDALETWGPRT
jgi:GH24 family phage-related lysozyme (muramidase)